MRNEIQRYVRVLVTGASVGLGMVVPARAQITNLARVTIDCSPRDDMVLVLKIANEYKQVVLAQEPPANTAARKQPKTLWGLITGTAIAPKGTLGSGLLRGRRTDWQPSIRDEETGAAWFVFSCGEIGVVYDVKVETDGAIDGWYRRWLPHDRSNPRSHNVELKGQFLGNVTILDVRFAPYSFNTKRQKPQADDPFESLHLQLLPGRPVQLGLLLNDPGVISESKKGWVKRDRPIQWLITQRGTGNGHQRPGFDATASDNDWAGLPKKFRAIKLTIREAGK